MDVQSVGSVLESVTVHAQGAVCTRIAQLSSQNGAFPGVIEVRGLPLSADPGSFRARVMGGPASLRVREVRPGFHVESAEAADLSAEQKALDIAEEELARLRAELAVWDRRAQRITSLKPIVPEREKGQLPPPTPVDALMSLARFADDELRETTRQRLDLAEKIKDAQNDVTLKRRRVQEASTAAQTGRTRVERTALISFADGAPASDATVAIEYVVAGARWVPAYELSLERTMDKGTLRIRAHLAQRTGEDWTRVRLSLSTAALSRRAEIPELKALKIGRRQEPPPRSGWREPPEGLDELFSAHDAAFGALRPPEAQGASPTGMRAGAAKTVALEAAAEYAASTPPGMPPPAPPPRAAAPMALQAAPAPSFASAGPPPVGGAAPGGALGRADIPPPRFRGRNMAMAKKAAPRREAPKDVGYDDEAAPEMAFGEAPAEAEGFAAPAGGAEPEAGLLDYGALVLPPNEDPHRGRLRRRPNDLVIGTQVSVHVDVQVRTVVSIAMSEQYRVEQLPLPAHARPVRQSAGAFDFRYDADHRVDLPSDGAWHMVPITAAEVALRAEYVTVPSVDPHVFRTVRVENASPFALLEGPADVLLGGGYLMTVPFPTVAPLGTTSVGLGVEEAIKVARNTKFEESTGGLLGGASVLAHDVTIELANRLGVPVRVEVRERVPVTNEKDVKIEEVAVKPAWAKDFEMRDGLVVDGARVWKVDVPAGGTQQLQAKFEVRIPASKRLVGGNRRV